MNNYFECKVKLERTEENGVVKKVNEIYLVPAISFADAENTILRELEPFISNGLYVVSLKRANYSEVFRCDKESAELWFKCKVQFVVFDDKNGKEKKTNAIMLVQAASMDDSVDNLNEAMRGTLSNYTIASVSETQIIDVFETKTKACEG